MEQVDQSTKVEFNKNVISVLGKTFYYMESFSSLNISDLGIYDGVIIDAKDVDFTRIIVKKFRGHLDVDFYLKPIFLINNSITNDPYVNDLTDGIILAFDQLSEKVNFVTQVASKITRLENSANKLFEMQIFKKALNYMFTRDMNTFLAVVDSNSNFGYTYPILSVNFDSFEESKVLEVLEWAEKENLIWPDFQDRVYLCHNCKGGHLSFREICPNCDSANIKSEDLVHHFPCGYIGPMSDFKNKIDTVLNCPKCSKSLRHIGVDYDKPSVINNCQNCNDVFQDYLVKAKCMQCKVDADVQFLLSKNINTYKLTKKGRNAAVGGIFAADYADNNSIVGALDFKTFSTLMHYEQERTKSSAALNSNLIVFYFENIFDLYKIVGKTKENSLLTEFVELIRNNIKPSDFICVNNPSIISICINDVVVDSARTEAIKISDMIEELVMNNFHWFSLNISFDVIALSENEKSFDKKMQDVIKSLVEKL
jgi:hypothetical protein